jgi:hypothetical protein
MSLVKKPRMTKKKLAALRRNAKLSKGPVTPEGRERIRAAKLRHGFYSDAEEAALRALGEEPADLRELREGLRREWNPTGVLQERLVARLARAEWQADRAHRMREGRAVRQAKEVNKGREGRLHSHLMHLKMSSDSLQLLAQSVAREHYVTPPGDLNLMKSLQKDGVVKEMGEVALALFYQLREPGTPGPGEPGGDEDEEATTHRVMNKIRAIFGLDPLPENDADIAPASSLPQENQYDAGATETDGAPDFSPAYADLLKGGRQEACGTEADQSERQPDIPQIPSPQPRIPNPETEEVSPYPGITEEEWEAREPVRQLLENILSRQVQLYEEQRHEILQELVAGPSPYERAAEIAPTQSNDLLTQRMEEFSFRQVWRITNLLSKMKQREWEMEAREAGVLSYDVIENKMG